MMTVFGHSGSGGGIFLTGKQVFPVDCEAEVSRRLLEASISGDLKSAVECLTDPLVDVNFVGAVCLKVRKAEVLCLDELPNEVRFQYEVFKTDVTALFVAVHVGNVTLVRKLLNSGADVNQKLFRGFSTTEAVRENHLEILEILLKSGASQPSCEEALMEASCHGRASLVGLLMGSDLIRTQVAIHALVTACCRGFTDVVDTLIKCGVDANATDRMLLQSYRPSLHANLDCTALVAAVVSRQVNVVKLLLQVSGTIDVMVRIGAWSWDTTSGEEFRVGAGMAEPYPITWCAVEYFEQSGTILRTLLEYSSPNNNNTLHHGRTLLHHAILCGNVSAVNVLLNCGVNVEVPVKTCVNIEFSAIHMAARLGSTTILQRLIDSGCDLNSRTYNGETALMISVKYKHDECFKALVTAGADFGLVNLSGQSISSIAESNGWGLSFRDAVIGSIRSGKPPKTTDASVFSPILFVAKSGDVEALKHLIGRTEIDIDYRDEKGFSAIMISAMEGYVDAFRLLVYAGAEVKSPNKSGETAITLLRQNQNRYQFEKVLLDFELEKGNRNNGGGFFALHCAARRGDLSAVRSLIDRGYDLNASDGDGYTPLMVAAREGSEDTCRLLISLGAKCDVENGKGETALSLAMKISSIGVAGIIEDEIARRVVINGSVVVKHTKGGRGVPHGKAIRMVEESGVLRWGESRRRNVVCKEVEIGASSRFQRCRHDDNVDDDKNGGVFRVVTMKNKEVHFECEGGIEMAKIWVRGIKLVTSEARAGQAEAEAEISNEGIICC